MRCTETARIYTRPPLMLLLNLRGPMIFLSSISRVRKSTFLEPKLLIGFAIVLLAYLLCFSRASLTASGSMKPVSFGELRLPIDAYL